eukprot:scaffold66539_cov52-Phaeocystis_antarctica.AAC.2
MPIASSTRYPGAALTMAVPTMAVLVLTRAALTMTVPTMADPLLHALPRTFHSCTHSTSDVKELVPEF